MKRSKKLFGHIVWDAPKCRQPFAGGYGIGKMMDNQGRYNSVSFKILPKKLKLIFRNPLTEKYGRNFLPACASNLELLQKIKKGVSASLEGLEHSRSTGQNVS